MVNFGPLSAEINLVVWGTPANFNGFRVLAALLHGTQVLGVSHTAALTEGATYIRQGGHHVGHWPTITVCLSNLSKYLKNHVRSQVFISSKTEIMLYKLFA